MEANPAKAGANIRQDGGLARVSPLAGAPAAHDDSAAAGTGPAGGGRRLLVVDDEESVRSLVKIMGTHLGFVVAESVNGAEALARLREQPGEIDLLLTDVNMPVMDGLALVRAVKELPAPPAVIVMTGQLGAKLHADLLAEGVRHVLGKPFLAGDLGHMLASVNAPTR